MRVLFLAPACLGLATFVPLSAFGIEPQDLCSRAKQEYGIEPAQCRALAPEPATALANADPLSAEIRESHVFFDQGGATLSDDAQVQLAVLVSVLNSPLMQGACLRLVGHSDSSGSAQANEKLALQRAETVAEVLRKGLRSPARVQDVTSQGELRPLTGLPSTAPANRRVEIQAKSCT